MKKYDVIVVGAGPAGLGAAIECGKAGASVLLIDENDRPGGQLFKQIHKFFGSKEHYAGMRGYEIGELLLEEAKKNNVDIKLSTRVWGMFEDGTLSACSDEESIRFKAEYYILATGATENSLIFEGNTLPGVMTAGAAQTMVNIRKVRPGSKAVIVGSGNVGLILGYQLLQAGVEVMAIVEAAQSLSGYEVHAGKVRRAGVPILFGHTVVRAEGERELNRVLIAKVDEAFNPIEGEELSIDADVLCIAVGLAPRSELADISGCNMVYCRALGGSMPLHNKYMQTTMPNVFVAGDLSGIEEASTALDEGRMAGLSVLKALGKISAQEAQTAERMISDRIAELRKGQFGEKRHVFKEEIWNKYENDMKGR